MNWNCSFCDEVAIEATSNGEPVCQSCLDEAVATYRRVQAYQQRKRQRKHVAKARLDALIQHLEVIP